jgi:CRISPR/Cas system-associated endoribonuclease Cas2
MKKMVILSALALVLASAIPSFAQTYRSEARENRQEDRIRRSFSRGELTPRELRNLAREQRRIDRAQNWMARDGHISARERRRIEQLQDRASRNIARKSNNGRNLY